ncbi:SDR family NAD(P)-dependent oxidoreductase [Actinobacteria bacterium YIM 96077]|uniref:Short-chain dehydrogenase n=1 Tax=Phytoactinopolyspora halophila TaxID=1981511 RepID=A0A329QSV5_9ACTN|nr:SDR family NAD(P)-dependent oxidoreductase [Phytoactinopolyspora halophila]AYY15741.1 SDR family NAD(P)-dependent oxidoreductase [Actinobacteria bacterium YIM 96077]RAW15480.1 hypothetical protein DPM12_08770 [Phytoactinopolyspora halophila]
MDEKWTERDIPDQKGRVAVVTGANTGLGFEAARALAENGASVVLAVRDVEKGKRAAARIAGDTVVQELDLTSLESIRAAAAELHGPHSKIDVLINNAGVGTLLEEDWTMHISYTTEPAHPNHATAIYWRADLI